MMENKMILLASRIIVVNLEIPGRIVIVVEVVQVVIPVIVVIIDMIVEIEIILVIQDMTEDD